MAIVATYTQQPSDRLDYDIPCDLDTGDSILSIATTTTPSGLTLNATFTSPTVKLWVEGGTSGVTYKTEVTVTTAVGRKKQFEVRFKVKEV
jgi:hypothetical protein